MKDLSDIYRERRSVNFFDPSRDLDEALLKKIIDAAVLAPSAYNLQPWRIIALRGADAKKRLHRLAFKQPKILEAPVTLILAGNRNGWSAENDAWPELRGMIGAEGTDAAVRGAAALYGADEEKRIRFAESNTALLAMSIMYAAKYFGVDTHPMSGMDVAGVNAEFGLSPDESAVMLLAMGYYDASRPLYPRRSRKGYAEIVTIV